MQVSETVGLASELADRSSLVGKRLPIARPEQAEIAIASDICEPDLLRTPALVLVASSLPLGWSEAGVAAVGQGTRGTPGTSQRVTNAKASPRMRYLLKPTMRSLPLRDTPDGVPRVFGVTPRNGL